MNKTTFKPTRLLLSFMDEQPRDIRNIIGALMGYINADPHFETDEFEQAIAYVLHNGVTSQELFSSFDSSLDFEEDPAKWTEEYYTYARVYLNDNFCRKRIEHVKSVAKKLYPTINKTESFKNVSPYETQNRGLQTTGKKSQSQQRSTNTREENANTKKALIIGVVVVVLAIIGILVAILK